MSQLTIYGVVGASGERKSGNGFKVVKEATPPGVYNLIFDKKFSILPAVVAMAVDPPSDLLPNAESLKQDSVKIIMRLSSDSISTDAEFSFIAMGEE